MNSEPFVGWKHRCLGVTASSSCNACRHRACGVQGAHTWLALPGHSAAACTAQSVRSSAEQAAERVSHARADASCALPHGVQQVKGRRKPASAVGAYTDCWSSSARHSPSKQSA